MSWQLRVSLACRDPDTGHSGGHWLSSGPLPKPPVPGSHLPLRLRSTANPVSPSPPRPRPEVPSQPEGRSPWSLGSRGASVPSPPPQKPRGFSLACALTHGVAVGVRPGCSLEAVGEAQPQDAPLLRRRLPLGDPYLVGRMPWGGRTWPHCGAPSCRGSSPHSGGLSFGGEERAWRGWTPRAGAQLPQPWLREDFCRDLQPPGPHLGPQPSGRTACSLWAGRVPRPWGRTTTVLRCLVAPGSPSHPVWPGAAFGE